VVVEDWVPAEIEEMPQSMEGIRACSGSVHGLVLVSYLSHSADLYHWSPLVVCHANVVVDVLAFSPLVPSPIYLPHPYLHCSSIRIILSYCCLVFGI
jgi:hypothetical protein